jgi:RND family efflux transporter MFP subunit
LRIDFQVPQEAYPNVSIGMSVTVRLDALPGREVPGHVIGIVPRSHDELRSFLLLTRLDEADARIVPGMSARGILRLEGDRDGVVVPRDAVLRHPDGRITVWVLKRAGDETTVNERVVAIGRSFAGLVEITDGLAADIEIVLRGNERLQENQRVAIVEP